MTDETKEQGLPMAETHGGKEEREESFAEMLDRSSIRGRLRPGQKVRAKVVSISGDLVYLDLGGKTEGVVNLAEFSDKDGRTGVREGDEVEAFFVTADDGVMKLTTLVGGYSAASLSAIADAYEAGVPVNGDVKKELKGGFEVSVGGVRCFCPFSHIDVRGGRDGGGYVGRTFPFKVLEYGEDGKKIVLSRRELLDQENEARIAALRERLAVGMDVAAEVRAVQGFGAFADLGGVHGLIPASEISWDRSVRPGDVLSPGQNITVKIISLDWERNRLALSMKALQPDPWDAVAERYRAGSRVTGSVVRLAPFGAFVRLEPGVEGLVHISNLGAGRRINHPREVIEEGQTVEVYVLSADTDKRKISLSMQPKVEPVEVVLPAVGDIFDGVVERVMPYGVFLKTKEGNSGLIPNVEMGTPPGTDHKRMFPPGTEMRAAVIEVDAVAKKVRLSRKAVLEKAAQDEFEEYRGSAKSSSGASGGFGTLGEVLRAKLQEKKAQD